MPQEIGLFANTPLSLPSLMLNLAVGVGLALVLRWHFRRFGSTLSNREEFDQVFPFVMLTTLLIITIVKSSLALSLGLVGALSIVRFRTPIKEPEELAYLFIAIAIGLMAVPAELIELGRSFKASKLQELYRIRLPYAVPFIFSGLKVAIALAVVGAVVGEFVNADKGLGYLIITATAFFKTPVAFGALILLSIMGIVLFQVVVIIERIFFPWSAANQEAAIT